MPLPFETHQLRQLSLARGPCAQENTNKHTAAAAVRERDPRTYSYNDDNCLHTYYLLWHYYC